MTVEVEIFERTRQIQEANSSNEIDDYNYVGKYDALVVWEREDGMRWSVDLNEWVTEVSNEFTSWIDTEERPELAEWFAAGGTLPEGGKWINSNEC